MRVSPTFISTRAHAVIDYLFGFGLLIAPWVLGFGNFDENLAPTLVSMLVGLSAIVMSMFTKYEYGVFCRLPFNTHLTLDVILAAFLAASPWLFDFYRQVFAPHLVVGLAGLFVVALTTKKRSTRFHTAADYRNLSAHNV